MNCKNFCKSKCCGRTPNENVKNENNEGRILQFFEINRQILDKQAIDAMFPNKEYKRFYYKISINSSLRNCKFTKKCLKNQLYRRLPAIQWLKNYKLKFLLPDFIAGLVVGILHIPFGLALANLATLPPVYGKIFF